MSDMAALQTFVIDAQPGSNDVLVDGRPVEGVEGFILQSGPGQVPVLTLHGPAAGTVTGAGTVQVVDPDGPSEIVTFLSGIDPLLLEQAALSRDDLEFDQGSGTRAMLAQLIDWASGR